MIEDITMDIINPQLNIPLNIPFYSDDQGTQVFLKKRVVISREEAEQIFPRDNE